MSVVFRADFFKVGPLARASPLAQNCASLGRTPRDMEFADFFQGFLGFSSKKGTSKLLSKWYTPDREPFELTAESMACYITKVPRVQFSVLGSEP